MYLTTFYAPMFPVATVIGSIGLLFDYWVPKFLFRSRYPVMTSLNEDIQSETKKFRMDIFFNY